MCLAILFAALFLFFFPRSMRLNTSAPANKFVFIIIFYPHVRSQSVCVAFGGGWFTSHIHETIKINILFWTKRTKKTRSQFDFIPFIYYTFFDMFSTHACICLCIRVEECDATRVFLSLPLSVSFISLFSYIYFMGLSFGVSMCEFLVC